MDHEIWRCNQLVERLAWEGPAWKGSAADELRRADLRARAIARAFELKGLSYERRNKGWLESDHVEFACREASESEVAVTTPIGVFRLQARRARTGETKTAVVVGRGFIGSGGAVLEDQVSLPVAIHGRLQPPRRPGNGWWFQPSHFVYADGTRSDYLGGYPRDITWEIEPEWPLGQGIEGVT